MKEVKAVQAVQANLTKYSHWHELNFQTPSTNTQPSRARCQQDWIDFDQITKVTARVTLLESQRWLATTTPLNSSPMMSVAIRMT